MLMNNSKENVVNCQKCGHALVDNAKFCGNCGASVNEKITLTLDSNSVDKANKVKIYLVFGSFIVIIICLFTAYHFFYPSNNSGKPVAEKSITNESSSTSQTKENKQNKTKKVTSNIKSTFSFKNEDHFGIMDNKFNIVNKNIGSVPTTFNQSNVGIIFQNEKSGLINSKGKIVLEPVYESIGRFNVPHMNSFTSTELQSEHGVMDFQIKNENKINEHDSTVLSGLLNSKGKVILEPGNYLFYPFMGKKMTTFTKNSSVGVISEEGKIIVEAIYENCVILTNKLIAVKKSGENSKFQVLDLKGELVKDTSYDMMYDLPNFPDHFSVTNGLGKSGIIDQNFKEVFPIELSSYISISDNHKYISFQKDDKYGLQSLSGQIIIEPNFDYLSLPNENNIMAFTKGDNHGLMDIKGNIIKENFSSNLYPAYETNMFVENSYDPENISTKLLNNQGEIIVEKNVFIPGSRIFPKNIYYIPNSKENLDNITMTVLNKDGKILSTKATFLSDLNSYLMIQEGQHIKIINKDTGTTVKETSLSL